ncbi:DNA alkylation repair protein [Candidatus Woesearchaeota archaeon]|nr:DNA alkylation repair protein [Candidatus Woesearchaeota archaeon]
MLSSLKQDLKSLANKEKAILLQRFFKTGKGEYGEGDIFLGIIVPKQRKVAKKYINLSLNDLQVLLNSKIHEERLISLFILVDKYKKAEKENNEKQKQEIFNFYIKNAKNINNWDLVDLSAPNIVGNYLLKKDDKEKQILYKLAKSDNLWEKRISILSTFMFIKTHKFDDSINIAEILLNDKHDLIHKAVGWMLRELGKRNEKLLINFLNKHKKEMPRTMLRYSIEKFSNEKRKFFMQRP